MHQKKISSTISIVSHGHGKMIRDLISDIKKQDSANNFKIIITLNLPDEKIEIYDQDLDIFIIRNTTPKGFGENHNNAFQHCDTTRFIILNPDIRLNIKNTLIKLSENLQETPAIIAPRVVNEFGDTEDSIRINPSPLSIILRTIGHKNIYSPNNDSCIGKKFYWAAGMCLSVNSAAYKKLGGFDTKYFLYCEDYDLCARTFLSGYSTKFDQSIVVQHNAQRDSHKSIQHLKWHLQSLLKAWTSKSFYQILKNDLLLSLTLKNSNF